MPMNHNVGLAFAFKIGDGIATGIWGSSLLSTYIVVLEGDDDAAKQLLGYAQAVMGTTLAAAAIPLGWLAGRYCRRDSILRALSFVNLAAIACTSVALLVQQYQYLILCCGLALWGVAQANSPVLDALFADSVPTGRRTSIYTSLQVCYVCSQGLGPALAALVFWMHGNVWELAVLQHVMLLGMAIAIVPAILLMAFNDDHSLGLESEGLLRLQQQRRRQQQSVPSGPSQQQVSSQQQQQQQLRQQHRMRAAKTEEAALLRLPFLSGGWEGMEEQQAVQEHEEEDFRKPLLDGWSQEVADQYRNMASVLSSPARQEVVDAAVSPQHAAIAQATPAGLPAVACYAVSDSGTDYSPSPLPGSGGEGPSLLASQNASPGGGRPLTWNHSSIYDGQSQSDDICAPPQWTSDLSDPTGSKSSASGNGLHSSLLGSGINQQGSGHGSGQQGGIVNSDHNGQNGGETSAPTRRPSTGVTVRYQQLADALAKEAGKGAAAGFPVPSPDAESTSLQAAAAAVCGPQLLPSDTVPRRAATAAWPVAPSALNANLPEEAPLFDIAEAAAHRPPATPTATPFMPYASTNQGQHSTNAGDGSAASSATDVSMSTLVGGVGSLSASALLSPGVSGRLSRPSSSLTLCPIPEPAHASSSISYPFKMNCRSTSPSSTSNLRAGMPSSPHASVQHQHSDRPTSKQPHISSTGRQHPQLSHNSVNASQSQSPLSTARLPASPRPSPYLMTAAPDSLKGKGNGSDFNNQTQSPVVVLAPGAHAGGHGGRISLDSPTSSSLSSRRQRRCCCMGPGWIPGILATTDCIMGLASGMTVKFFPIWLKDEVQLPPTQVNLVYMLVPLAMSIAMSVTLLLSKCFGRVPMLCFNRAVGISLLYWITAHPELWSNADIMVPLFIVRTSAMNSLYPLRKSILSDYTNKERRAGWNSLEAVTTFGWSGSAVLGGFLIQKYGFQATFMVTAYVQTLGWAGACLLLLLVPCKERSVAELAGAVAASLPR